MKTFKTLLFLVWTAFISHAYGMQSSSGQQYIVCDSGKKYPIIPSSKVFLASREIDGTPKELIIVISERKIYTKKFKKLNHFKDNYALIKKNKKPIAAILTSDLALFFRVE